MPLDVLKPSYSYEDAAFALDQPNLGDLRRNWARFKMFSLPQPASRGRAGVMFRIAHLYEYSLLIALARVVGQREVASELVRETFARMRRNGGRRINALSDEEREAVLFSGPPDGEFDDDEVPHDNYIFIKFPQVAFDPEFLRRDPHDPYYIAFYVRAFPTTIGFDRNTRLDQVENDLKKQFLDIYMRPDVVEVPSTFSVINITETLKRVDDRLRLRLKAREIGGR